MSDYTLLVLAAGMGSRYGGLKQMDKIGPEGETIIDYSIYDALAAGFTKIVFVIRKSIEADFKECFLNKYQGKINVDYVLQELDDLPAGFQVPADREKPWGTGHAILMAKDKIKGFFAVINGDDFYGRSAFFSCVDYLKTLTLSQKNAYSMVAYRLDKTLSENGTVSRGVCQVDENDYLLSVQEHTKLESTHNGIINTNPDGSIQQIAENSLVSMNFWVFHPSIFEYLQKMFEKFLKEQINNSKSEFYIPFVVDTLIQSGEVKVKVLKTDAQWYGVTYREDRGLVHNKLVELTNNNIYSSPLWK